MDQALTGFASDTKDLPVDLKEKIREDSEHVEVVENHHDARKV